MKKFYYLLLTVAVWISAVSPALAEEFKCYFNKPDNWPDVYVWAWDSNKQQLSASSDWPGEKLTTTDSNGYYVWSTTKGTPTGIIFSTKINDADVKAGSDDLVFYNGKVYDGDGNTSDYPGGEIIIDPIDPVDPSTQWVIYFDNTSQNWDQPYIHYWGGASTSTWPGEGMHTTEYANIWTFTVADNTTNILFNAGDGDDSKSADFDFQDGHVYTWSGGDSGKGLEAYIEANHGVVIPSDYKWVYFDNTATEWATPHIHYWGGSAQTTAPGKAMILTEHEHIWSFKVPAGTQSIQFNDGTTSTTTGNFAYTEDHVYTYQNGDSGKNLEDYLAANREDDPSDDVWIYAEVPDSWSNMKVYVYDGENKNATWPGLSMTWDADLGLWKYHVDAGRINGQVIFYSSNTNRYPADGKPGLSIGGKSMIYRHAQSNLWEAYEPEEPIEPGDDIEYKIHFHNTQNWPNVHVRITGVTPNIDASMSSFLNSVIYDYTFTAPENANLKCQFYEYQDGQGEGTTSFFKVINGHVYTISGDKGLESEYDPNNVLPEKEYWLDPEKPSARESARLYFRRDFNPDGPLKNTDKIYIHAGLIKPENYLGGASGEVWDGARAWSNPFEMTRDSENPNLYYIDLQPSMAGWFGVDGDASYGYLGLIFRDKSGNTKQHSTNQYIPLRVVAPVGEGLGAVTDYEMQDDGSVKITSENGSLFLTPWSRDVVKVFTLRASATNLTERRSISVIDDATKQAYGVEPVEFSVEDQGNCYAFAIDGGVTVAVDKETSLLSFFNYGNDQLRPDLEELGGLSNRTGNVSVTFQGMNDRAFYGGGYNGNLVNWDGQTMTMNNSQQGNWGQGATTTRNICIPFYVSTEGYGVYFDDHYRSAKITPSRDGTIYNSGSQDPIAYYYIGGGSMEAVMQNYTTLTGRQQMPPYWALGYITSKFSFETRQEAEQAIQNTKNVNVPIDGIVFDIHWQSGSAYSGTGRMGRIDWERDAYPDPQGMMQNFRNQNVHTIAITEPYFTTNSYNYETINNNGWFADADVSGMQWLNSSKVGLLDITNPGAVRWFQDLYKARTQEGIESWWLDLGEPERHDDDSRYQDGTVSQVHNEYGLLWNAMAAEAIREAAPNARFITMPRAGTSGMQRYNAFPWTGDIARSWGGLAAQVPALVSGAMSGVSYLGSDIGGFTSQGTNPDLYRRWVQLGVFYPSMRTHSQDRPEVWRSEYSSVLNDVRDAINLRYAYLPYTYTQSYLYTRYGTPIARPANYADEDKSVLKNEIGTYFWGPDVFVAPVLSTATTKTITFPEGDWLDMNDFTTIYRGHQTYTVSAPTNVLPRFMRRGAFVPRFKQDQFTSTAEIDSTKIIVDYFATDDLDTEGSVYYEDDHHSVDPITSGRYLLTKFSGANSNDEQIVININYEGNGWPEMPANRSMVIRIHDFKVTNGGVKLDPEMLVMHHFGAAQAPSRVRSAADMDNETIRRAAQVTTTPFVEASSADEVHSSDGHSFYHDVNNNKLYLSIPAASTTSNMILGLGKDGVITGLNKVSATAPITLSYGNRLLTYSAPQGVTDLRLDIFTVTGALVKTYGGLTADGYAAQQSVELPSGVYIVRLSGLTVSGQPTTRTIKAIVE